MRLLIAAVLADLCRYGTLLPLALAFYHNYSLKVQETRFSLNQLVSRGILLPTSAIPHWLCK